MKKKTWITAIILFILMIFSGKIIGLYTDWLWFNSLNFGSVFTKTLIAKFVISTFFVVYLTGILMINFILAWKLGNPTSLIGEFMDRHIRPNIPSEAAVDRILNENFSGNLFRIGLIVIACIGISIGLGFNFAWKPFLSFFNSSLFNLNDPLFNKDIGFYVFKLPFIRIVYDSTVMILTLSLIGSGIIHVLKGNISIYAKKLSIVPAAKTHIFILLFIYFLVISYGYRLDMYNLLYSQHGVIFGGTYSDVNVFLPFIKVISVLAVVCAITFLVSIFLKNMAPPLVVAGIFFLVQIISWIYPEIIHRFVVLPNEISVETPYISRNITFTRAAYGLDKIDERPFPATYDLTMKDIREDVVTVDNIRLWDHRPLLDTYSQLQEIRTYYRFDNVSNDRYTINGKYRQVMIAPRELEHEKLPSRIWINEHLTYTHGYGIVMNPVNEIEPGGLPRFMIKDIPPVSNVDVELTRPEIYYGRLANDYMITNTESKELDYPAGDKNVYTMYQGKGGVPLNSFFRKLVYAIKFGNLKIILSRDITKESRIIYHRQIVEQVKKIMPLIEYDDEPYIVVSEGKLYWIIDGYTITDKYPYSQPVNQSINYIRNAVKVVIDAYNGSVSFYVADSSDPIIQSYSKIFHDVFQPLTNLSADLQTHIRYPQDMFKIQTSLYSVYHMTIPQVFYNKEDMWNFPKVTYEEHEVSMDPYYMIMKLPGETKGEYILMQPFTPSKKDNMIAWMAVRSDGDNYGKIIVYRFPKDKLVYGPKQIEARIDQDDYISQQFTLWGQRGSSIIRGNLTIIPIKESLLYVEPIYLQAERGKIPELKRVIVSFGDRLVMEETLDNAIRAVFTGVTSTKDIYTEPRGETKLSISDKAKRAWEHFQRAKEHQRKGNWSGYGEELKQLEEYLKSLAE